MHFLYILYMGHTPQIPAQIFSLHFQMFPVDFVFLVLLSSSKTRTHQKTSPDPLIHMMFQICIVLNSPRYSKSHADLKIRNPAISWLFSSLDNTTYHLVKMFRLIILLTLNQMATYHTLPGGLKAYIIYISSQHILPSSCYFQASQTRVLDRGLFIAVLWAQI